MSDLIYVRPMSVAQAVALLGEPNVRNRVLAGGTDLVNQFREGEVCVRPGGGRGPRPRAAGHPGWRPDPRSARR